MAALRTMLFFALLAVVIVSMTDADTGVEYCPAEDGTCVDGQNNAVATKVELTLATSNKENCLAACRNDSDAKGCEYNSDTPICHKVTSAVAKGNAPATANSSCWAFGGTKCRDFLIVSELKTFEKASTFCNNWGGYLATVPDAATNTDLNAALVTTTIAKVWIGYTDKESENTFAWVNVDDASLTYSDFDGGSSNDDAKDCASVVPNGQWLHEDCSTTYAFICSRLTQPGLTHCPESVGSCADVNNAAVSDGANAITPAPISKEACLAACRATANATACDWDGTICTSHTDASVVGANGTAASTLCWIFSSCIVVTVPLHTNIQCKEKGFVPAFTYDNSDGKDVLVNVTIGSPGLDANCSATESANENNTAVQLAIGDFGGGTEYPYKTGSDIGCNGTFADWNDTNGAEKIKYEVGVAVVITETAGSIQRKMKYNYQLRCEMSREGISISTSDDGAGSKWTIDNENLEAATVTKEVSESFELSTSLKFYKTSDYSTEQDVIFVAKNNHQIYMQVSEDNGNDLFVFTVEKCWATAGANAGESNAAKKDVFFKDQCQEDSTVKFSSNFTEHWFKLNLLSFYFKTAPTDSIYFHCTLNICLQSGDCKQKLHSECPAKNRKRRSVTGFVETRTITSAQHIILDRTQIFSPDCGPGFIYDRVNKLCSNQQLLEVKGIYLDIEWNPLYANTSSKVFREFAREKEYQLFAMLQVTGRDRIIVGLKVIGATKGSVVLNVLIKYAESTDATHAFREFEEALHTRPSTTRVMRLLNVRQDKTIEYVLEETIDLVKNENPDKEKLVLIVVVVVFLVVVFISGITLLKVKQIHREKRSPVGNLGNTAFDNKGVDA